MIKKKITAAELMARLNADPEFVAARAAKEAERLELEAEYRRAETPLVDELRAAGLDVHSSWDLVNTPRTYLRAIPILLAHLPRRYPAAVREGIARALAVPETKALGWDLLTRLYVEETERRVRGGLAAAIAAAADDEVIEEVIALARDARHGSSRLLLLSALERSADERAQTALMDLAEDPDLKKEIEVILKRLGRKRR